MVRTSTDSSAPTTVIVADGSASRPTSGGPGVGYTIPAARAWHRLALDCMWILTTTTGPIAYCPRVLIAERAEVRS